jgi:hypothetical protein
MRRRARAAAARAVRETEEIFEALGRRQDVQLRLHEDGRIFGGSLALEISTVRPVLPRTAGLRARARGVVRTRGVSFSSRRGDEPGGVLARRLEDDRALAEALSRVHFERVRVEPDGRPVIRHMGGSVVWVLFPPFVRAVPLTREQAKATLAALDAFAVAGETAPR